MKPYYQKDGIQLFHGDCREVLAGLEAVDLLLMPLWRLPTELSPVVPQSEEGGV